MIVYYIFLLVFVALTGIFTLGRNSASTLDAPNAQTDPSLSVTDTPQRPTITSSVVIGQTVISVELATTTVAVQKGLSGRISLDPQSGMLFVFAKSGIYSFWMPDMHFPLDIIWINNGRVVDISENVSNKFDPARPRFYIPSTPARYILEVNAGFAASKHIRIGDTVIFNGV